MNVKIILQFTNNQHIDDNNNEMKELKKHASDFSILIDDQRSTNAKIGFVFLIVCGITMILSWDKFKRR